MRIFSTSFLACLLLCAPAGTAKKAKRHDLKFKAKPAAGQQTNESASDRMAMNISVSAGKKTLNTKKEKSFTRFDYTKTILEVTGEHATKVKMEFTRATRLEGKKEVSYGFEGKTVIIAEDEDGNNLYRYEDGSELSPEDVEGIKKAVHDAPDDGEEGMSGEELFAPPKPVLVGESWKPDLVMLACEILDIESPTDLDLDKSSGKLTLKSVKVKDGAEFASVKGTIKLYTHRFGDMKAEKPILVALKIDVDACADGTLPDGKALVTMKIMGKTDMTMPEGDLTLTMDIKANGSMQTVTKTVTPLRQRNSAEKK